MGNNEFVHYESKTCFCEFISIKNVLCFIYVYHAKLISYDVINKKILTEIYFARDFDDIADIRHCLDKINKRDLILSCRKVSDIINVWDFKNWEKIIEINPVNKNGALYSSCFFNDNNKNIYILTSNIEWNNNISNIKVFDLKKNKIKEINDSKKNVIYIDTYFDSKLDKNLIVTCNENSNITFYDFYKNFLYKNFIDNDKGSLYLINDYIIYEKDEIKQLIGSCEKGYIKIWDYDRIQLIKRIQLKKFGNIYGLGLLNNKYILGGINCGIFIYDLINGKIIKIINGHKDKVKFIKLINIENEEIIVSGGFHADIIFWENKNFEFNIKNRIKNNEYK